MKIAFLPQWCKYIALVLFFGSLMLVADELVTTYLRYYNEAMQKYETLNQENNIKNETISNESSAREKISSLTMWISLLIYVLSKGKRDDDFIQSLRIKSLKIALLLGVTICFLGYIFNFETSGLLLLELQLVAYLLTFKVLKVKSNFQAYDSELLESR